MRAPLTPQELVTQSSERWDHCEQAEHPTLLRLSVLRDLIRALHAEKSHCLARGLKIDVDQIRLWENKVELLRNASQLKGSLIENLNAASPQKKRTRLLPEALFNSIAREKLERFDRTWEASLAAEAVTTGWRFWALEAWVELAFAENWNNAVGERLWPHGIPLYVEAIEQTAAERDKALPNLWHARWIILFSPKFRTPDELNIHLSQLPGASPIPNPPQWRLLFSPKER